jgi:hypothetical protein
MRNSGVQTDFLEVYDGTKSVGPPTFFDGVHNMSMRYMMDGVMWLGILMSIGISLYFLWEIISAFGQLNAFRKPLKLLRHAFLWTSKIISRPFSELDFSTPTWAKGTVDIIAKWCLYLKLLVLLCANLILLDQFVRRFGVHMSFFSICAVICAVPGLFFLGFPFRIFHHTETKNELIVVVVVGILFLFVSGLIGGACCLGLALSIRQIIRPFFQDLDDPRRERLAFEF